MIKQKVLGLRHTKDTICVCCCQFQMHDLIDQSECFAITTDFSYYIAHWFRNGNIDQQFKNSKNIDFRENIVKQEMSIYAKAKSVLICTINV